MELINGDCLLELINIKDKSIDFVYLDLPYGQTACDWDKKLDLKALWIELRRIAKNDRTPFFFSCTTKFGFELFNNSPKGFFRWDLVWEKNRAAGFLNAYKLPMRKHEMVYCFAKKTPEYDVSSHKYHYENNPRPRKTQVYAKDNPNKIKAKIYEDPLPTSVLPPQDNHELVYCFAKKTPEYDVSSHNEKKVINYTHHTERVDDSHYGIKEPKNNAIKNIHKKPLPTSVLDIPSSWCKINLDEKINHRTAKPVKLMEFLLKYWSKEGDTILDPTAGSGSMGVACKNMNRKFIGIEKDDEIFKIMKDRINNHLN